MPTGLRRELMLFGIKVILIEPRAVITSIWEEAERVVVEQFTAGSLGSDTAMVAPFALVSFLSTSLLLGSKTCRLLNAGSTDLVAL
jgi:short-subunit dehydrogenase